MLSILVVDEDSSGKEGVTEYVEVVVVVAGRSLGD